MHERVRLHEIATTSVRERVFVHAYVRVSGCDSACKRVCPSVHAQVWVHESAFASLRACVHEYACMHNFVCISMRQSVHPYTNVCVVECAKFVFALECAYARACIYAQL